MKSHDGVVVRRNVSALARKEFDLVIVGGGIFGMCAAWDAMLRGLSVALVERGDFAYVMSVSCFQIIFMGYQVPSACSPGSNFRIEQRVEYLHARSLFTWCNH